MLRFREAVASQPVNATTCSEKRSRRPIVRQLEPVAPRVVNERTGVPIDVSQMRLGERRREMR